MADALGTAGGVVSAVDHRLNQAGLIAPQTSSLAVRTGVMVGPGSTTLVTGTAATGTMTVSIAAHHWVTTRGTADGVYLGTKEAAGTVNIAAAPGANSRIDVVYVKQNDAGSSISPDGSTAEAYGVVTGTAAASPTKPALPVGAVELATVTVAAGATATNGAGVTITNTAPQVSARGARIWVRNQAERDALTAFPGLEVYRLDTGRVELCTSTGPTVWAFVFGPRPHFDGYINAAQSIAASSTWTDVVYDGERYDTDNGHSAGAVYTIPVAGWWDCIGSVGFAAGAGARGVRLAVNGVLVDGSSTLVPANSAVGTSLSSRPRRLFLAVGDQVKVQAYQSSGGSLALLNGAGSDQVGSFTATFDRPS